MPLKYESNALLQLHVVYCRYSLFRSRSLTKVKVVHLLAWLHGQWLWFARIKLWVRKWEYGWCYHICSSAHAQYRTILCSLELKLLFSDGMELAWNWLDLMQFQHPSIIIPETCISDERKKIRKFGMMTILHLYKAFMPYCPCNSLIADLLYKLSNKIVQLHPCSTSITLLVPIKGCKLKTFDKSKSAVGEILIWRFCRSSPGFAGGCPPKFHLSGLQMDSINQIPLDAMVGIAHELDSHKSDFPLDRSDPMELVSIPLLINWLHHHFMVPAFTSETSQLIGLVSQPSM